MWFGFYPCLWQIRVVEAILKHDRDIISVAATGAGKTLTFWMPLLFSKGGIQVVVTPLNILGDQNINDLKARGVSSIAISAENATKQSFEGNFYLTLTHTLH
jgi:superfamily II DNA helicase RecQ